MHTISEEELTRQLEAAEANYKAAIKVESAFFDADTGQVIIELENSSELLFIDYKKLQGLENATEEQLKNITCSKLGIHWEDLDVDFEVEALVKGFYGNKAWMQRLNRTSAYSNQPPKEVVSAIHGACFDYKDLNDVVDGTTVRDRIYDCWETLKQVGMKYESEHTRTR